MTPGTGSANGYSFDASSNLTTLPTGATASYNDAGQLTSTSLAGATTSYTYNADGEQLTSTQGSTTESSATWNGAGLHVVVRRRLATAEMVRTGADAECGVAVADSQ